MTDQWVPGPAPAPPQWVNPLPPSNDWSDASGCAPGGPSIVDGILITGVPATVSSLYWQVSLNDGSTPPNFQINQLDGQGNFVSTAAEISPTGIWFDYPVLLSRDPVEPMEAVTLEYLEAHGAGVEEAPMTGYVYGRGMAQWYQLPTIIPDAPNTSQLFGRFNSTWALVPIQADAPSDGGTYGRLNGAWNAALPIAGGTVTGSLTVNQVLTVQGSNSLVLNAPVTGGSQRTILGMASNVARWGLTLGDGTAEGLNNVGSNFSLAAYSTTGAFLGNWLTIARADGNVMFNGSGMTLAGSLAVNGYLTLPSINNFSIYGGLAGQVIATNGSGILSWVNQGAYTLPPASTTVLGGVKVDGTTVTAAGDGTITAHGIAEAPTDGKLYSRQSSAWTPISVPINENRIINGDMRIDQRWNGAATSASNYSVDRWAFSSTVAVGNCGRNLNAAVGPVGFPYYLGFQTTTAHTPAATDFSVIQQAIEADYISDFAWGTANAQPVTLSFWAWSSLTGTFSGAINNYAATRSYLFTFSLPVANTWTKITINIPGDISGTWTLSGNGGSVLVGFDLGSGASRRGAANTWTSQAQSLFGVTGAVSVIGTNGASFYVTGVKLEIGSVATPFNRQSMAKSMADCQRYYEVCNGYWVGDATINAPYYVSVPFAVEKRASPTLTMITQAGGSSGGFNARVGAAVVNAPTRAAIWGGIMSAATGASKGFNDTFSASAEL